MSNKITDARKEELERLMQLKEELRRKLQDTQDAMLGDGDGRFRGDKSARGEKRRFALQQLYDRGTTER